MPYCFHISLASLFTLSQQLMLLHSFGYQNPASLGFHQELKTKDQSLGILWAFSTNLRLRGIQPQGLDFSSLVFSLSTVKTDIAGLFNQYYVIHSNETLFNMYLPYWFCSSTEF